MRYLFVCTNAVGSGKPTCGRRGGNEFMVRVQKLLIGRGARGVTVTPCGCLGPCFDGPNAVIFPDNVWYGGLTEDDAEGIVEHLVSGVVYEAKRVEEPGQ